MGLNSIEVEITRTVLLRFLNLEKPTPRKELVVKFKEPETIDGLIKKSLLNRIDSEGKVAFVPKLLAFHYCGEPEVVRKAKTGLEIVLHVLQNLFELEEDNKQITPTDIEAQALKMYGVVEPKQLQLGIYLVREFNVLGSYATNAEGTKTNFLTINEQIITLKEISQEWDNRVQILSHYLERDPPSLDKGQLGIPVQFFEPNKFNWSAYPVIESPAKTKPQGIPQVFISYSWENIEHKQWVVRFASQLQSNGVSVILDRWHLQPGGDKSRFMEVSVTDSDFVILICTPQYASKANERKGGVGYEAMIITGELAGKIDSRKFIPILRAGEFESALPVWIKSRLAVDLRGDPYNEDEYEDLLRTLHGDPVSPPPLGSKPTWRTSLFTKIEVEETKLQLPELRPEIRIEQWGPPNIAGDRVEQLQRGFHLHNSGRETALGITIGVFKIHCDGVSVPVSSNDPAVIAIDAGKDAFALIFISHRSPLTRFNLDTLLSDAYQGVGYADQSITLTLNYSDAHGRNYQTDQALIFSPRIAKITFGTPQHKLVSTKGILS